jgi:hypothetical protein
MNSFNFFLFQNVYGNIHRVLEIADKLSEVGHYEADRIEVIASSVDSEWKSFDMEVNQRSSLLSCSVAYHHHSEEVGSAAIFINYFIAVSIFH